MLPKFYRKVKTRPCLNCVLKTFLNSSLICGISKGKCCHDEEKICSFSPCFVTAFLLIVSGFFSLAMAIYEVRISFNGNNKLLEAENLRAMAIFFFTLLQSLLVIIFARKGKIFSNVLTNHQNLLSQLVAVTLEADLVEDLLKLRFQVDFGVLLSISLSIISAAYRSCSNFTMVSFLAAYLATHLNLGILLIVNILLKMITISHTQVKTTLNNMVENRNLHLSDMSLLRKRFNLIIDFQFSCYKYLNEFNEFISFISFLFAVYNSIALYLWYLIRIISVFKGDIFVLIQPALLFLYIHTLILLYLCKIGTNLMQTVS